MDRRAAQMRNLTCGRANFVGAGWRTLRNKIVPFASRRTASRVYRDSVSGVVMKSRSLPALRSTTTEKLSSSATEGDEPEPLEDVGNASDRPIASPLPRTPPGHRLLVENALKHSHKDLAAGPASRIMGSTPLSPQKPCGDFSRSAHPAAAQNERQMPTLGTRRAAMRLVFVLCGMGNLLLRRSMQAADKTTSETPNIMTPNPRLFSFVGGNDGPWKVTTAPAIIGEALPAVERLKIAAGNIAAPPAGAAWVLHGATSNERYVTRPEKEQLLARQQGLGRPEADCAVLIPIKKNAKWWALTEDERRQIFEAQSHHTQIGLEYLPAIARRLASLPRSRRCGAVRFPDLVRVCRGGHCGIRQTTHAVASLRGVEICRTRSGDSLRPRHLYPREVAPRISDTVRPDDSLGNSRIPRDAQAALDAMRAERF